MLTKPMPSSPHHIPGLSTRNAPRSPILRRHAESRPSVSPTETLRISSRDTEGLKARHGGSRKRVRRAMWNTAAGSPRSPGKSPTSLRRFGLGTRGVWGTIPLKPGTGLDRRRNDRGRGPFRLHPRKALPSLAEIPRLRPWNAGDVASGVPLEGFPRKAGTFPFAHASAFRIRQRTRALRKGKSRGARHTPLGRGFAPQYQDRRQVFASLRQFPAYVCRTNEWSKLHLVLRLR